MRILCALAVLCLSACGTVPGEGDGAGPPIVTAYALISMQSGAVVAQSDPDRPVLPASTQKLITALAVIDRQDRVPPYETLLCRDGGILRLVGTGDPSLDVEDLLALAVKARDKLSGPVAGFEYAPAEIGPSIDPRQPSDAAYNPHLSTLSVAEGAYRGYLASDGSGWTTPQGAPLPRTEGTDWYAQPDPPALATRLFRQYLAGLGLTLPPPKPAKSTSCPDVVAKITAPPLTELLREMLWTSSNPMAERLGHAALQAVSPQDWLLHRYPDLATAARLDNFSGLSATARVTPRLMASLLAQSVGLSMNGTPFIAMLTPAGWDGGLKKRLLGPPTALQVWAKTGTMHYGVGLAGYALIPGKGLHAFAVYAFDPAKRAAYDMFAVHPGQDADQAAKAWDRKARAAIDETVRGFFE